MGIFSTGTWRKCQRRVRPFCTKCAEAAQVSSSTAVLKTDGLNAWRVLAFWFQARSTNDSMSLLTVNPDRAKDRWDVTSKLDRWDALIRDK